MPNTIQNQRTRSIHDFRITLLFAATCFSVEMSHCQGQSVIIDYMTVGDAASTDPITIPAPDGGFDIIVTPGISIGLGSLETTFTSDVNGKIVDGPVETDSLNMIGEIDIQLASEVEVFGFPVSVTANLAGPFVGNQTSPASGALINGAEFAETIAGMYDIALGPLDCTDSAFGVFCSTIEAGLGIEFPTETITTSGTALPLTAVLFSNLNDAGSSTVSSQLQFSIPIGDAGEIELDLQLVWNEENRQFIVPEPSAGIPIMFAVLVMAVRSRGRRKT